MRTTDRLTALFLTALLVSCGDKAEPLQRVDLIIANGEVVDGSGVDPIVTDVVINEGRIVFIGDNASQSFEARQTIEAEGLWITPGFIDMHSHAELGRDYGRDAAPYLYQGITTAVLGVDGDGDTDVAAQLSAWETDGIGVNALTYIGHGALREAVMGLQNRPPTGDELNTMRALVRQAMDDGAFGLSTGLFYVPGSYASTDEVIELARAASTFPGAIYDTHDRDLGAAYQGIGYDASVEEGIRIGKESGTRVIFSHYNLQGAQNRGRGDIGAQYINDARASGIDVWAAQHPYTATQSSLRAYTIPTWAAAGGHDAMIARFDDPALGEQISRSTYEMLDMRGGADKILLVDERPGLNGRTLAQYATENELKVHEAVQSILRGGNATVMNLDLYDHANTRTLAAEPWMMTCTDGRTPHPDQAITHPRTFGAFPMKYRLFVVEENVLTPQEAIRSFSGLAADFLRLTDRGYLRTGYRADVAVIDPGNFSDHATFDAPQQFATGVEYLFVNGEAAIFRGKATGALAGQSIRRPDSDSGDIS